VWLIILRTIETVVVVSGAIATVVAARFWLQAQKVSSLSEAKDEAIRVARNNADAWKGHYEAGHLELETYRKAQHAKNEESQGTILSLTSENATLKSRTDLSPILTFHKQQSEVNEKIVQALKVVVSHLEKLLPLKLTRKAKRK
jgi:hypothetical protein